MAQGSGDCYGRSIYRSVRSNCNSPSDLYDQKGQVDSILEYLAEGLQRTRGIQGYQGDPGLDGPPGDQGLQGLTGSQGVQGVQGLQGPTGDGSSAQVSTLQFTTSVLPPGDTEFLKITSASSYQILSVETNVPAWVRLYGSAYGKDQDTRIIPGEILPKPGSGLFLEVNSLRSRLKTQLSPVADVQVDTSQSLFLVRNESANPSSVTVTLEIVEKLPSKPPTAPPYNCDIFVNTSGQTDLSDAWKNCTAIDQLPLLDLDSVTNLESAWEGCSNLTFVPSGLFDNCPCTNLANTFTGCSLTSKSVDNILVSLDASGGIDGIVDITGGSNISPSPEGLAAKLSLEAKGWTVNVELIPGTSFVDLQEEAYSLASSRNGRVFAGGYLGYVFKSTDYGASFDAGTSVDIDTIKSIAVCDGNTILAGNWSYSYLFVSNDNGATWTEGYDFNLSEIDSIAHAGNGVVYVGTYGYIHKSIDNGQTWTQLPSPYEDEYYLCIAFPGPDSIVVGTYDYGFIAYSFDGGSTWGTTFGYILGGASTINCIASNGDGVVIAGTDNDGKIYRSLNSGVSWDPGIQLGGSNETLAATCSDTGVFFAGTDSSDNGRIYSSSDNGETWQEFFNPNIEAATVYSLSVSGDGYIIAGIDTFIYKIPYDPSIPSKETQIYPTSTPNITVTYRAIENVNRVKSISDLTEVNPTQNTHFDGSEDEESVPVPLGFSLEIFGKVRNVVNINSNSYLTFGGMAGIYGESTYADWVTNEPNPGVFIGSDDGKVFKVTSTGAIGTSGSRTNTIRFEGNVNYGSSYTVADVIWEVTFKENQPNKIYLNILAFNEDGGVEGSDFFTFSSLGTEGKNYISPFYCGAGEQYEITLANEAQFISKTGSKININDSGVRVSKPLNEDHLNVDLGLSRFLKSDNSEDPTIFGKIENVISLSQYDYDNSIDQIDPYTLYVIVN